jgi:hypothetical protein
MAVFEVGYDPKGSIESCIAADILTRGMIVIQIADNAPDGKKKVELPNAATDKMFGVVLNDAAVGEAVDVYRGPGICPVLVNAALATLGTYVIGGVNGKAIASAPAVGTNHFPIGRTEQVADAADELIEVFVNPGISFQG